MDILMIIQIIVGIILFIFSIYTVYIATFQGDEGKRKLISIKYGLIDTGKFILNIVCGIFLGIGVYYLINNIIK